MALAEGTQRRVRRNHERVRSLVGLAGMMIHTAGDEEIGQDVLRAATVLLHASLDDFLRTVAKENWPRLSRERLKLVPLPAKRPGEKITFLDLRDLQGRTVDDLVRESVFAHLDATSFNQKNQVAELLGELGIPALGAKANDLKPLMKRRHHIVHQADKDPDTEGNTELPIVDGDVELWLGAVEYVCNHVIESLK